MSTLQVANLHFESTGNNRLQYTGSNGYIMVGGGQTVATVNTTAVVLSPNGANSIVANTSTVVLSVSGTTVGTVNTTAFSVSGNLFVNSINYTLANTTQYRAANVANPISIQTAWDSLAEVTLTDAATVSWNMGSGFDFTLTLAGNRTLANATNLTVGKKGRIRVIQDAGGSKTLSYQSMYKFPGGLAPVLTTTGNAQDYLYYDVVSSTVVLISAQKDVK